MDKQMDAQTDKQIVAEIEEPVQLAHLSATHSNALVENPFD